MCKHVAGKIVKQYYSIQCHLSVQSQYQKIVYFWSIGCF